MYQLRVPPDWDHLIVKAKGRILPARALAVLMMQVLQDKYKYEVLEGAPEEAMRAFLVRHMTHKFGTKGLIQERLAR